MICSKIQDKDNNSGATYRYVQQTERIGEVVLVDEREKGATGKKGKIDKKRILEVGFHPESEDQHRWHKVR